MPNPIPNNKLTPDQVKAMSLQEFEQRFGFIPIDALEKRGFAMMGERMNERVRAMFLTGMMGTLPDLTSVVMEPFDGRHSLSSESRDETGL